MVKSKIKPKTTAKLTPTQRYWNQVDQHSHYLVADLLNQVLPLPNLRERSNLDLEKDADYRTLFFEFENNYSETENLPESTILAEEMAYEYLCLVVKSILHRLSEFSCHLEFENLFD